MSISLASSAWLPPRKIWILGAGRFGSLAVKRLSERHKEAQVTAIDVREEKLVRLQQDFGVTIFVEDAVSFLVNKSFADDIWIIPAVPVHVAFQWLLAGLAGKGNAHRLSVPDAVDTAVPNPFRVTGTVYTSFATFVCPDFCNEPDKVCTYTRMPRQGNLYERLNQINIPGFEISVIRSWQLAPGVGGYMGGHLRSCMHHIALKPGKYLVATSCRCHGVIDALSWNHLV